MSHDHEGCGCCGHEHHHNHEHHEHHDHDGDSLEMAGGCAVGIQGTISNWNAGAEDAMVGALMRIGYYVTNESSVLLGHIKAAIFDEDGHGVTLNLIDLDNGVERHGGLGACPRARFAFMCAVLDVDEHELEHQMFHAVDDSGLAYELDEPVECHCHDHCHDHGEEHRHHHGHGQCSCGCCNGVMELTGTITGWNADTEARLTDAVLRVAKWAADEYEGLDGEIGAIVTLDSDELDITVDDLDEGVEKDGSIEPAEIVRLSFKGHVKGADHELLHTMFHAIVDSAIDCEIDQDHESLHHHEEGHGHHHGE